MKVLSLIEKRYNTAFGSNILDEMIVEASRSNEKNTAVILTEGELSRYHGVNKEYIIALRENNRLKGMFDLGVILPNTSVSLVLYVFTKDRTDSFVVGEYLGTVQKRRIKSDQPFDWKTIYSDDYYEYLHKIERWVESGDIDNSEFSRFNRVKKELFEDVFAPKRYSENVYRVKAALETEKTVTELDDMKDVISYVKNIDYVDPDNLFLMGESMGGLIAAYAASEMKDSIRGLILWYPAFQMPEDARTRYAEGNNECYGVMLNPSFNAVAKEIDVGHIMEGYKGPVLIIHGDEDPIVPIGYSEKAAEEYVNAELSIIKGGGHGFDGEDSRTARELSISFIIRVTGA